ncbi:MAG: GDSL-type esterase/lipase family protein [Verrucomicrobia bacterium]|nr:GDSL-type esterase/lipase family protein [Verrucomicrobiota bacterium]
MASHFFQFLVGSCLALAVLHARQPAEFNSPLAVGKGNNDSDITLDPGLAARETLITAKPEPARTLNLEDYARFQKTAPVPGRVEPVTTRLPLELSGGQHIVFIGNTLFDRDGGFGHFETLLHQRFPSQHLVVRNLAWSADEIGLQPRPANFATLQQQLTIEKADVIFAAFGFNESFAGTEGLPEFRDRLADFLQTLKTSAFNGVTAPRTVLVSPIANENVTGVLAADLNNARLRAYTEAMREAAAEQDVGFANVFSPTLAAMDSPGSNLTFNGVHLEADGYEVFARALYQEVFKEPAPQVNETLREAVIEKNKQYFRRYRPLNTFYYTGDRNKTYGYLDFLPAMRNFDLMVANRDRHVWDIAQGRPAPDRVDDSNVPPLPPALQSRSGNEWLSPADELAAFKIDPRFSVNLFASEEQFPDIACPIQMRWDAQGRLWVSCSTTYPHVYPGNEPNDKIVILEDTDGDGRADKSTVWADDLQIPLSFEFGDGGVYVSEEPHLVFLQDTDGDGKADFRRQLLTGFGCEDSHHALHDFVWTPDGDLLFREAIFHHSQVETPYGPVRAANSAWFRFRPANQRLITFGNYPNTNPWGVTFDDWGNHVASHPVFASAFHALNPPYPQQHPGATGLPAYSGVCGHEFVDFPFWPKELLGGFIKVRYKPSNRVEIHKWIEHDTHYEEEYQGDLLYSSNLSFIPTDIRFGPRGALYVCDWYNPIKGHMQYSLRDERRDRSSGRIWRIVPKGAPLQNPPVIAGASIPALIEILKRPEYRYRYWTRRELRERDPVEVKRALDTWVARLDSGDPRFRHHQIEAIWLYRNIAAVNTSLLRELLDCEDHHARAAATEQLRNWHPNFPDAIALLRRAANDPNGRVRMEAAIAASYIGTREALDAALEAAQHPRDKHLAYAFACALGSENLRRYWENDPAYARVPPLLKNSGNSNEFEEPSVSAQQAQFDNQKNLKTVRIECVPERMQYTVTQFTAETGQPVKLVFTNPDATDHNLVIVQPGALEEVGMAANEMAKDPKNANSNFHPPEKKDLILEATPMIGPMRKAKIYVLRFRAPEKPGIYPYVCTFPGHWVVMTGEMLVVNDRQTEQMLLASRAVPQSRDWKIADLEEPAAKLTGRNVMRGMKAFMDARCNQCHQIAGHGIALGPDLTKISEKYRGGELLRQILEPSAVIDDSFRTWTLTKRNGEDVSGTILKDDGRTVHLTPNLLMPDDTIRVPARQITKRTASQISPMPEGMLANLNEDQILDLLFFLETGGFKVPEAIRTNGEVP